MNVRLKKREDTERQVAKMENYLIPWWKTDLGRNEINEIEQSILNRWITQGPVTEKLEKKLSELLGVPYVLLTTSGSAALLMALMACGVKPGDEVIVPALTFIATAQAPSLLGANVKLVDVEREKPVMNVRNLEKIITAKTKVIIPVHLNGRSVDMEYLNKLAAQHDLKIVEDAAQALCSKNPSGYLGAQSDIGVFSLGITKLITTGKGGVLIVRDKETFEKLKKIRNSGMSEKKSILPSYDILGFNFEFNDILASMGLSQFEKIEEKIRKLNDIYRFYREELKSLSYLKIIEVDLNTGELPLWVEALCPQRDKVIALLKRNNVQAKPSDPCVCDSLQFKNIEDFKNSKHYADNGLILPCGPDQPLEDRKYTVEVLRKIEKEVNI